MLQFWQLLSVRAAGRKSSASARVRAPDRSSTAAPITSVLTGAYNQILLDGLPLMTGVGVVYGVEQIPAVLVDRVEVVKGGASVLYGPGAVAGVVNVVPMRPEKDGVRALLDVQRVDRKLTAFGSLLVAKTFAGGFVNLFAQGDRSPGIDLNDDCLLYTSDAADE